MVDDAYRRFLRTTDLSVWRQCLAPFEAQLRDPHADVRDLARGALVATYVLWLGAQSGDDDALSQARAALRRFQERIGRAVVDEAPPEAGWATAIGLASSGYHRTAEDILSRCGELSPDVALLITPTDSARLTSRLRDMALQTGRDAFPLTFYFYCDALLQFGRIGEVSRLVRDYRKDTSDPIVADLVGKLHERGGRWQEALEIYARSPWPIHRLRAAVCRVIGGAVGAAVRATYAELEGRAMRQALAPFETEVDQLELARSSAFVNACRWNAVEGWLIEFELGKLAFRRRRYWEADEHLSGAEASCPPDALFAVRSLRFSNLTWLSGSSSGSKAAMLPEALESGVAALEAADEHDDDSFIRVWIARELNETRPLRSVLAGADWFAVAQAHRLNQDELSEISALLSCVAFQYVPRAMYRLIEWFSDARFYRTADHLTGLVLKESADDFFALWELGSCLLSLRAIVDTQTVGYERLTARIRTVSARLQELSQFDFQHLIRAFEFFADQERDDIAELILTRASTLAEGAEEHLAVAAARRSGDRFGAGEGFQQGLACLVRAEREARHSIDRLQVAREYFHYGQIQRGRAILEREGLFNPSGTRRDIEYIVALECGRWLEPAEFQAIARHAVSTAARNLREGVRRRFDHLFLHRLLTTISEVDRGFAEHLRSDEGLHFVSIRRPVDAADQTEDGAPNEWAGLLADTRRLPKSRASRRVLVARLGALIDRHGAAGYVLWSVLLSDLNQLQGSGYPSLPAQIDLESFPLCKNPQLNSPRAVEIHRLWRQLVTAATDAEREEARQRIRVFHEVEQERLSNWQRGQWRDARPVLRKGASSCRTAEHLLSTVIERAPYQRHESAILRELHEHLSADAADAIAYVRRREAWMWERLRGGRPPRSASMAPASKTHAR
jgi:hypothetical protein